MIGIIDYQGGNPQSVANCLRGLGYDSRRTREPEELDRFDALILPGVGAADSTMASLAQNGMDEALTEMVVGSGRPFLGICVGMQILFEHSTEGSGGPCLGWLPGRVARFDTPGLRVPQMGWNRVVAAPGSGILDSDEAEYFYFVNSYRVECDHPSDEIGTTTYGTPFPSAVRNGHIFGVQFHAEKSSGPGLRVIKRFAEFAGVGS